MSGRTTDNNRLGEILAALEELALCRQSGALVPPGTAQRAAQAIWPDAELASRAAAILAGPHLPLSMLWRSLGRGLRGNPLHPRPLDQDPARLADDLWAFLKLHQRIVETLPPETAPPDGGMPAGELVGDGGWCDLCGQCCAHAGTVPTHADGVDYPAWWYHAISGQTLYPQPFCPFLFQAVGQPCFYCAIHAIKPLACSRFGREDCARGLAGRGCRP